MLPDSGPVGKVPTDLEGCDDEADEAAVFAGVQGAGGCAPLKATIVNVSLMLAICHAAPGNGDRSAGADTVKCHSPERFYTVWVGFETSNILP